MHIAIEAERANNPVKTGVEHYAAQLIAKWGELGGMHQFTLLLRTRPEPWFLKLPKQFVLKVLPFPVFWTQVRLSIDCLLTNYDRLFIPASALPIFHPAGSIITIHDLAWWFFPKTFTLSNRIFLWLSTWYAVKRASKIIAVSHSTKQDLIRCFKVPEHKIAVVHHGYTPMLETSLSGDLADKLPEKYIVFLSTLQPRKNLERLILALKHLRQTHGLPHKLVVVGKLGWMFEQILKVMQEHSDFVVYLGHVADTDRGPILKNAACLVVPSLYEGFGMTILEGFDAGTPVITSNVSSMPEVGGEAAAYVNPEDTQDIAKVLARVLTDSEYAQSLVAKGKVRLKEFSWQRCAENTLAVIEKAQ